MNGKVSFDGKLKKNITIDFFAYMLREKSEWDVKIRVVWKYISINDYTCKSQIIIIINFSRAALRRKARKLFHTPTQSTSEKIYFF